jgi:uncharacterized protein YkuJ
MSKNPPYKILSWTTKSGTEMSAHLYYLAWWDDSEKRFNPKSKEFIEALRMDFYANGIYIGTMDDEKSNGEACLRLFEIDGETICNVFYDWSDQLIVFDNFDFKAFYRALDDLAKEHFPEIYKYREQKQAQVQLPMPMIHYY